MCGGGGRGIVVIAVEVPPPAIIYEAVQVIIDAIAFDLRQVLPYILCEVGMREFDPRPDDGYHDSRVPGLDVPAGFHIRTLVRVLLRVERIIGNRIWRVDIVELRTHDVRMRFVQWQHFQNILLAFEFHQEEVLAPVAGSARTSAPPSDPPSGLKYRQHLFHAHCLVECRQLGHAGHPGAVMLVGGEV